MSSLSRLPRSAPVVVLAAACLMPAGCLAPAPRNFTAWILSGDEEVTPATPPRPENEVYSAARQRVQLSAALNETLALQLVLRAKTPPAGPFDLRISDLAGPGQILPAASTFTLYRVQYVRVDRFRSWYTGHTGRRAGPTLVPDRLVPWDAPRGGGPVTLAEDRNEIVWIDLRIPPAIPPGDYRGRIELRHAGTTVFASDVQVSVLPVALPGRRHLPMVCRIDPRPLLAAHVQWFGEGGAATAELDRNNPEDTRILPNVPAHSAATSLLRETLQLFHSHGTAPVLWASFPKLTVTGDREIEVQWEPYDQLVSGWLDGSAFADQTRLEVWPLPVSLDHPSAERYGGLDSPRYAAVLSAYLEECRRHFAQRGWLERAVLRPAPPAALSPSTVDGLRRITEVVRHDSGSSPLVAHLPARSLRGLGWQDAPAIDVSGVGIWAPPAMWFEPPAMEHERQLGRRTWLMPDHPPYSPSLDLEAPATDPRALPWIAYRYDIQGLWLEHAAEWAAPAGTALQPWTRAALIWPGEEYGVHARPLPSVRLKRLRQGLQDYELLRLLEDNGRRLLARELAEHVVRWAGTDACLDNLVSCAESGWPREPGIFALARTLMLRELAGEFEPNPAARQQQIAALSEWGVMLSQRQRIRLAVEGARLTVEADHLRAHIAVGVINGTNRPIQGCWRLPTPPPDWQALGEPQLAIEPGTRRSTVVPLRLAGLAYNADGVYPFELAFESDALETLRVPVRLAVAVCPVLDRAPVIDGRLTDWPLASSNTASDFRLWRPAAGGTGLESDDRPVARTQAFFGMDAEWLYAAVRCALPVGDAPVSRADNDVPIDGPIPWGQDVVEVLLDPRGAATGTSSDVYCLQVKPTGLLIARRGCRTEPPMGTSQPWHSGARAAVTLDQAAWFVELAVPLAALGPEARRVRVWGVNVTRLDARRGEYSSWAGARGYTYVPRALGNLIMLWP